MTTDHLYGGQQQVAMVDHVCQIKKYLFEAFGIWNLCLCPSWLGAGQAGDPTEKSRQQEEHTLIWTVERQE